MKRLKTGIKGFDKLIEGGIPQNSILLVSGGAGTGKSTFSLHYAYTGAKGNEKTVFFTTEESPEKIINQAEMFGMNLKPLIRKGTLRIVALDPEEGCLISLLKEECTKFKPKRIVIDSLTTLLDSYSIVLPSKYEQLLARRGVSDLSALFSHFITSPYTIVEDTVIPLPLSERMVTKFILLRLFRALRQINATTLLTSELLEDSKSLSRDSFSEFMSDGVVILYFTGIAGEASRNLQVRKMRMTKHERGFYSFDIVPGKGIVISESKGKSLLLK